MKTAFIWRLWVRKESAIWFYSHSLASDTLLLPEVHYMTGALNSCKGKTASDSARARQPTCLRRSHRRRHLISRRGAPSSMKKRGLRGYGI